MLTYLSYFFVCLMCLLAQNYGISYKLTTSFTYMADTDVEFFTVSPLLTISYYREDDWFFKVDAGFSYLTLTRDKRPEQYSFDFSNPLISLGRQNFMKTSSSKIDVILSFGIPLATFPGTIHKNRLSEFNYNNANSSYGWKRPYSWLMNVIPISLQADFEKKISKNFSLRFKLSPAYLTSVNSRASQLALLNNYEMNFSSFKLGWVSFYSSSSIENNDVDQHSVYLTYDFKLFKKKLQSGLALNIDKPNGILEKGIKPKWGVRFSSGL